MAACKFQSPTQEPQPNSLVMPIHFRLYQDNRRNSKHPGCWYALAIPQEKVHLKKIAKLINAMCTVTEPDVLAVLSSLIIVMKNVLQEGKTVVLNDFGSFRIGVRSKPATSPKAFSCRNIREFHLIFHPKARLINHHWEKDLLKGVDLSPRSPLQEVGHRSATSVTTD